MSNDTLREVQNVSPPDPLLCGAAAWTAAEHVRWHGRAELQELLEVLGLSRADCELAKQLIIAHRAAQAARQRGRTDRHMTDAVPPWDRRAVS